MFADSSEKLRSTVHIYFIFSLSLSLFFSRVKDAAAKGWLHFLEKVCVYIYSRACIWVYIYPCMRGSASRYQIFISARDCRVVNGLSLVHKCVRICACVSACIVNKASSVVCSRGQVGGE